MKNRIDIIPLGGIREHGESLYAVNINGNIYVLDCGLRYPDNAMLGIDLIIPDFTYLERNRNRVVGIFLTDGCDTSIGALPYLLNELKVPVFGSKLTIEIAKSLIKRHPKLRSFHKYNVINENSEIIFNDVTVTFFKTTSSVPDSMGIVLNTSDGEIVYTGSFKFDQTVTKGYATNLTALSQIEQKHPLALLENSNNAEDPHAHAPEEVVQRHLIDEFRHQSGRIIVGCMSDYLLRIQQIFRAAYLAHRKIYLVDQDPNEVIRIALKLKRLRLPAKNLLIKPKAMKQLKPDQQIILYAGQMGDPLKAIQRMTNRQVSGMKLRASDWVLIATTPFPSIETKVAQTKDMVCRVGGRIEVLSDELNSTMHANQSDLRLMLNIIKPQYLIPVQGEFRMLKAQVTLVRRMGFPIKRVIVPSKGDVISYRHRQMVKINSVPAGNVIVDGIGVGDVGNIVLRDRRVLSEDGIFIAVVTIDRKAKRIVANPEIASRGFIYTQTNPKLMDGSRSVVKQAVQNDLDRNEFGWSRLKQDIRDNLNSYLFKLTSHHPVIMPIIMEINQSK